MARAERGDAAVRTEMVELYRHRLLRLTPAGWARVLACRRDAVASGCLAHWAAADHPLVVRLQPADVPADEVAVGLPAPARFDRRRIALTVALAGLSGFDDFPDAASVAAFLPPSARPAWHALADALVRMGTSPRIHGSFGWQRITGLDHVHAASDIDLRLRVADARAADAACELLQRTPFAARRLDGELVFGDGSAVAWREWPLWRSGQAAGVLVKRLGGVALEVDACWLGEASATC